MSDNRDFHDYRDEPDSDDIPCPQCGHATTLSETCEVCGGDGHREYMDAPEEWGEDCPSEKNHLIECRTCSGTGIIRWCPASGCGADYWRAKARKERAERIRP